LKKSLFLNN